MTGLLSSIFEPASDGVGAEQAENSVAAEAEQDFAIHQQVDIDAGVTYHDMDGGTHSIQLDNDVGINADASAGLDAVLGSGQATYEGDG